MNNSDAGNSLPGACSTLCCIRVQSSGLQCVLIWLGVKGTQVSIFFTPLTHKVTRSPVYPQNLISDPVKNASLRFLWSFLRGPSVHENTVTKRLNELKIDDCSVLNVLQSRISKQIAGRVGEDCLPEYFFLFLTRSFMGARRRTGKGGAGGVSAASG